MTIPSTLSPLRVSDNGRYFVDCRGRPFFWLGDTLWHLFRAYRPEEVREMLQRRKDQGFSVVQVMLIGYEPEPRPNVNGDLPWRDNDPARPNERYFAHVDEVMRIACELDFVVVLGVYHKTQDGWYQGIGNGESGIGPEEGERPEAGGTPALPAAGFDDPTLRKAREAARWVAARYREVPQIIWSMYPEAKARFVPIVRAIAEGLREGDGGTHLITVHPDPAPQSSSFLHHEPWLDFNSLQTCVEMEQIHAMTLADYALTPVKPVVMAEGGYEGVQFRRDNTPLDMRRQAYWTYLAGGHHSYGHNGNWQAPEQWREWIEGPGAQYLGVYRRIITSLKEWWTIRPNQSVIARGGGEGMELNAAGVSEAGDWAMVYLSGRHTVAVRMHRVRDSERVTATWIDPRTGAREPAGEYGWSEAVEFTTPEGWEDAIVIVESGA